MRVRIISVILFTCSYLCHTNTNAQNRLYTNEFPLPDVTLLDGPLKHARDLNVKTLLRYDTDRLLAPFRKEAGLPAKAADFKNWAGLDGHVGGHYLSALAMNTATGDAACRKRMDYMLAELNACQEASARNNPGWGVGYIGGVPKSREIWSTFKTGDFKAYHAAWVPWYNVHKLYGGLRDAWLYTGDETARKLFLNFCDWGINITSGLTDAQMEAMLNTEHGGMNEVFADAYQMTKQEKYLTAARRFSHHQLLDPMAAGNDNLDNKHANTQVPKAIGFHRIGELTHDDAYTKAGTFFWETVTGTRSLAIGGNSRREFFPSKMASTDFVSDVEGPESCNTYNMLKLTEDVFRMTPDARYVDFYERALFNHILSTQHPTNGGYVYFTPARPRHYRVYSTPDEAMWCCVGSGMENHGKYGQFIYTHRRDSLFVNLFVASELNWRDKKIRLRQTTRFPDEEATKLTITDGSGTFPLLVRYPSWVKAGTLTITVNGKKMAYSAQPGSYVAIKRAWKKGDVIAVSLPMHNTLERMPNVPNYVAILHGPIVLGARTGTENMRGLLADDSRWGHIAGGERLPVDKAPILLADNTASLTDGLVPVAGKSLTYRLPAQSLVNATDLVLEPFYRIHDTRYMLYWMALSRANYRTYLDSIAGIEKEKLALQKRTVDAVAPGEQQPEVDHGMQSEKSRKGSSQDAFWREASDGGFFSYNLATEGAADLSLLVRYWGAEWGTRKFDIYIDDQKLTTEDNTGRWNQSAFKDITYPIPASMVQGKKAVRVKFQALPHTSAGPVYAIRLVRKE